MPYHFFINFKNQDLWSKIFQIVASLIFYRVFQLISLMMILLFRLWRPTHAPWLILFVLLWNRTY